MFQFFGRIRKRTLVTSCENTTEVDVKLEWCKSCVSLATQYNCPGCSWLIVMVSTDPPRLKILSRQESLLGSTSRLKRMGSERFCTLMFWKSAPDATVSHCFGNHCPALTIGSLEGLNIPLYSTLTLKTNSATKNCVDVSMQSRPPSDRKSQDISEVGKSW